MNCANHPDLPVSAYCQNCGKPLCTQCVRPVAGVVYCEPCLAARLNPGSAFPGAGSAAGAGAPNWTSVSAGVPYTAAGVPPIGASPKLAAFLGLIPGVGAMYNGQFVKAFAHVVIFVILIGVANHFDPAGILVAAWIFYQVFDGYQTAAARRDGRPLPDPFGLNDLGQRLGMPAGSVPPVAQPGWTTQPPPPQAFVADPPPPTPPMPDPSSPEWAAWTERVATEKAMRDAGFPVSGGQYQPIPQVPPAAYVGGRPEPIGAIVLIAVGMLFLLSTLGVFRVDWIGRGWPVLIIVIGAAMLFKRVRSTPPVGGGL
jgi:TM2 domain-containing membrane protein YozV